AQPSGALPPPASSDPGSWQLAAQPERSVPAYAPGPQQRPPRTESGRLAGQFAASDLIDPEALPSWVRGESVQQQQAFSSTLGWTSKQQAMPRGGDGAGGALRMGAAPPGSPGSNMLDSNALQHPGPGGYYSGMLTEESAAASWSRGGAGGQSDMLDRGRS